MKARLVAVTALLAACSSGLDPTVGADEPIKVPNGAFQQGLDLPEPTDPEAPLEGTGVTLVEAASRLILPGQAGRRFTGRTTTDATAVAVKLVGLGSGAWTVPVEGADPSAGGELTWQVDAEFARNIPVGTHKLRFGAIDAAGVARGSRDVEVCALPPYPDNLNVCDPTIEPPTAVLSLAWDAGFDLDLVVVTPAGKIVDGRRPTTSDAPGGPGGVHEGDGAGCAALGARREHLVWQAPPVPGTYLVYVRTFDACGLSGARFHLDLRLKEALGDSTFRTKQVLERSGVAIASDARGGADVGLFVTEITFE